MTNTVQTVAAGLQDQLATGLQSQITEGRAFWDKIVDWFAANGVDYAMNIAISLVMLLVGWLVISVIAKLAGKAIAKALEKGGHGNALFATFATSVISKVCWAVLIVMILGRLGVNVGPLIAGLGVTGFILGFAFQESLGNLASGMMIAINQPFKVGDVVDAAGFSGTVKEVNMMATVLWTGDRKRIVIPNKSVWGGPITNYSALDIRRVDFQVGIAYGENVDRAVSIIGEAIARVPGVLKDPAPAVAVATLADSAVTINVRPWAKNGDYWAVMSGAQQAVLESLLKAGVDIPFPQLTVHQV